MEPTTIWTVLITLITILGSQGAWKYYSKRAEHKESIEDWGREECEQRVNSLENLVEEYRDIVKRYQIKNEELTKQVLKLTEEVATLRVEVRFLKDHNGNTRKEVEENKKGE